MTTRRTRARPFSIAGLTRLARRAVRLVATGWSAKPARKATAKLAPAATPVRPAGAGGLHEVMQFGSNPGRLRMLVFSPSPPPAPGAPLIVVLHGCQQDAAAFARDAGWMDLAQRIGCALLLPVQVSGNNRGLCFNWFSPDHATRDRGEAMSIRQMVRSATRQFASDRRLVFVVGLSAGGAMAASLLVAYPAVFAGGAVVAGMAVGSARSAGVALLRMRRPDTRRSAADWVALARAESGGRDAARPVRWPLMSIWQGLADSVVAPGNAQTLALQWTGLHGLTAGAPRESELAGGVQHRSWGRPERPAVELWSLPGMGHGFPVDPRIAGHGRPGAHVLTAAIAAAPAIAEFWGIGA